MKMKTISLICVLTQLVSVGAFAESSAPTPEFTLLQQTIALQGERLSSKDMQSQVSKISAQYASSPQAEDGQSIQRLEKAIVDLNLYTPAQAAELANEMRSAAAHVSTSSYANESARNQAIVMEAQRIAASHPAGAQFSACPAIWAIPFAAIGVGVGAVAAGGGDVGSDQPTLFAICSVAFATAVASTLYRRWRL